MKDLTIILWLILWPLMCSLEEYISTMIRIKTGEYTPNKKPSDRVNFLQFLVWVIVTFILIIK